MMTPYQEAFILFWNQVIESIAKKNFAKLTMAKTIGKPSLKNIFIRPLYTESDFKMLVKFHYASKEMEDEEIELNVEDAFELVKSHLKTSFLTVLLFDTTKDITFKINKKGVGTTTEGAPTFQAVIQPKRD